MLVGYPRVSIQDQKADLQTNVFEAAGCEKIFMEKASGAQCDRPELKAAQGYISAGDKLVVWKLDQLEYKLDTLIKIKPILLIF
jgi:DNA invertase Pin-like site-specific DNA recombinase